MPGELHHASAMDGADRVGARVGRSAVRHDRLRVVEITGVILHAHSLAPREPAPDEAPPDLRHASATRKSNAPASAQEVARQLRPRQAPEPGPESRVVPEQAPAPNVAPASPTEVPRPGTVRMPMSAPNRRRRRLGPEGQNY